MTGLEFKTYLLVFGIVVIAPAFILALLRTALSCEGEEGSTGSIARLTIFCAATIPLFVILVIVNWDDHLHVDYMIGYSFLIAVGTFVHASLVLLVTKLFGAFISSKVSYLCLDQMLYTLAAAAFFWNDIVKGEDSTLLQYLMNLG
jgi:hypothetical protein